MPNSLKHFRDKKKARRYRNKQRRKNYRTGRTHQVFHKGHRWTAKEIETLLSFDGSDRQLAKKLKRSVQAIQIKRSRVGRIFSDFYQAEAQTIEV